MEELNYGTGAIKDTFDWRDIPLEAVQEAVEIPLVYDPRQENQKPFISSQGKLGTCTGHAGATLKEHQQYAEHRIWENLSSRWVYAHSKHLDGSIAEGSFSRVAAKVVTEIGVCLEDEFPEENTKGIEHYKNLSLAKTTSYETAEFTKSKGYARVNTAPEYIKQAIFQNKAVLLAVGLSFQGWKTADLRPPVPGESVNGHSICAIGYNDRGFILENSWGPTWGDKGCGYLPYSYPRWDAWVVTDIPDEWLTRVKNMPKIVDQVLLDKIFQELLFRNSDTGAQGYIGRDEDYTRKEVLGSIERERLRKVIAAAREV